ncbi:hypothetical protein ACWEQU_10585 [Streptomyces nodosus]
MGFDWEKAVGVPPRADGADLRISTTPWTSASGVADELRTATNSGLADLEEAGIGTASGTQGFDCTAALSEIRTTWEARLTTVRSECERLHGSLGRTGTHFGEIDRHVKGRAAAVPIGNTPDWAR